MKFKDAYQHEKTEIHWFNERSTGSLTFRIKIKNMLLFIMMIMTRNNLRAQTNELQKEILSAKVF